MTDEAAADGTVWVKVPLSVLRWSIGATVLCSAAVTLHFANLFLIHGDTDLADKFRGLGNGFFGLGLFCLVMNFVRSKRLGRARRVVEETPSDAVE